MQTIILITIIIIIQDLCEYFTKEICSLIINRSVYDY